MRFAFRAAISIIGLCLAHSAPARPTVIVTVDVESSDNLPLPAEVAAVCTDGSACGLMEIVRMLQQAHVPATFFLNVYEYKAWGKPAMKDIALKLANAGEDVALHTHPQWVYDPNQPLMYGYSLEQQTRIVQDGVQLLREWTGQPVLAHRAGAYSADRNTLQALARNGIRVDSSLFFGEAWSHLNGLGLPNNLPSVIDGITEIPVSVFESHEYPAGLRALAPPLRAIRKIDVNALIDAQEGKSALAAAVQADFPYIVVFLHSFSLIDKPGAKGALPTADHKSRRVFVELLADIASARLPTTTMSALASGPPIAVGAGRDSIPQVIVTVPAWRYLWHARHARYGLLLLGAGGLLCLTLAVLTLRWALGRRRRLRLAP